MLKQFIENLFGIGRLKEEKLAALAEAEEANRLAEEAKEAARLQQLNPKEAATEKQEPWVAVLDTHVNKDNIRNGFFELDWNEYFVSELRANGYTGATDEEIVDKWFKALCSGIAAEDNVDMTRRGAGFINVNNLGNGRTEVY